MKPLLGLVSNRSVQGVLEGGVTPRDGKRKSKRMNLTDRSLLTDYLVVSRLLCCEPGGRMAFGVT